MSLLDTLDPDADTADISAEIEALAQRQKQALIDAGIYQEAVCKRKLLCQFCFILIGPGCHATEVHYHAGRDAWICRGCAEYYARRGDSTQLLMGQEDLCAPLGTISRELKRRSKRLRKEFKHASDSLARPPHRRRGARA